MNQEQSWTKMNILRVAKDAKMDSRALTLSRYERCGLHADDRKAGGFDTLAAQLVDMDATRRREMAVAVAVSPDSPADLLARHAAPMKLRNPGVSDRPASQEIRLKGKP
jgi:hypothetical protein